jgi:hypothetical protein
MGLTKGIVVNGSLVSKTGYEKGVKRVSVFDEMRVKLKPQPIINGDHNDSHRQSF